MTRVATTLCLVAWATLSSAQEATLEYRVKAAYLYNFAKYVEWPASALGTGPFTICVAGRNVFGAVLDEIVQDEEISERPIVVRVILEPEPGCHVVFVPQGAATTAYLRATRGAPVLTVGEGRNFVAQGGMVNFVIDGSSVRFEIDQATAERAGLRISSRLMRLARPLPGGQGRTP